MSLRNLQPSVFLYMLLCRKEREREKKKRLPVHTESHRRVLGELAACRSKIMLKGFLVILLKLKKKKKKKKIAVKVKPCL